MTNNHDDQRLLDHIYAAAWDPAALNVALQGLADLCRSRSAGLFHLRDGALAWEQSWNMPDGFMADFAANAAARDPRVHYGLSRPPLTLMRDDEPTLRRAMCETGVDAFARHYGLPYTVSCALERAAPAEALALYVSRGNGEGRPDTPLVDTFSRYAPHFARAMAVRQRVRADLARHAGANATVKHGGAAAGVLGMDDQGQVRWLDGAAERLLASSDGLCLCGARLQFGAAADGARFERIVRGVARGVPVPEGRMAVLQRQPPGWLWLQVAASPAPHLAGNEQVLVHLQRREERAGSGAAAQPVAPTPRQLQVLTLLAEGLMSKQIGARLGIAENTVRNHIQQLLRMFDVPTRTACVARARACGLLADG